ncbi:MAG: HD domain-containing protein [Lachnospiraceae bacterium]|nr:HD domain-containing protein [Lachnospiraceae bacterium]
MKYEGNRNDNPLLLAMIEFDSGDAKRVQHFIKVYQFAKLIGEEEGLDEKTRYILETAAIVHDIGIRPAERKYGSCNGRLQEQEGPAEAERLLSALGYDADVINRVSYLVGHHHTYTDVDGMDYRILLEADFLVNLYEDGCGKDAVRSAYENIFRTESGKRICRTMFGVGIENDAEDE